jgi:hypothetical protein
MEKRSKKIRYSSLFFKEEVNLKSKIQNPKSSDQSFLDGTEQADLSVELIQNPKFKIQNWMTL